MHGMRITVLGCSGGVGPGLRTTCLLLDGHTLIDAGTGLCDLDLDRMRKIGDVYLTHSHLDHVCGLAFMADNLMDLVDAPIRVHASAETLAALRTHLFNWTLWPDFSRLPSAESPLLQWVELAPGQPRPLAGGSVQAFPVVHTVPGVGYAVTGRDGVFAFSGDTTACAELWQGLNALPRLDHLMIEVAFDDDEVEVAERSRHLTPARLAQGLRQLRHRPRLHLSHHKPGSEAGIEGQCRAVLAGWDYRHLRRGDTIDV